MEHDPSRGVVLTKGDYWSEGFRYDLRDYAAAWLVAIFCTRLGFYYIGEPDRRTSFSCFLHISEMIHQFLELVNKFDLHNRSGR